MRFRSYITLSLLCIPLVSFATDVAYEQEIVIPSITKETSVWVPLDPLAVRYRLQGYEIIDETGVSVPLKQINETKNMLQDATVDEAPSAASTVPLTRLQDMIDGNSETAFQPQGNKESTFRFHFDVPVTPSHLLFQLSSGWIEHIRVRLGTSQSDLHDAFVGTPSGTSVELSREVANIVEITIRTQQGVLKIAEAELLAPQTTLLMRAQPNHQYVLRYGTQMSLTPPAGEVFTDADAITATVRPVKQRKGEDADKDGIPDTLDNCPQQSNAPQHDRDGDGIGDVCDNAPAVANRHQSDRDHDGVGDLQDNCPNLPNADQRDDDLNGVGFVCDDADSDGIMNSIDNCIGLANTDQRDLNHNGIGDLCEDDRDHDGIPTAIDNCKTISNIYQADMDRDGIGDSCDDCVLQYDPKQIDRDGNGIGDVCQQAAQSLQKRDSDHDTIFDEKDNCPLVQNSDQADQDGDGVGDLCDNCKSLQNKDQSDQNHDGIGDICTDSDADTVLDPYDNCIAYANLNQADRNQNGIGDPCDDDDDDGIENARDNCPYDANALQSDEDKDGAGNVCDHSDDRWSEKRPWLLYGSISVIILALTGFGVLIMKRSSEQ